MLLSTDCYRYLSRRRLSTKSNLEKIFQSHNRMKIAKLYCTRSIRREKVIAGSKTGSVQTIIIFDLFDLISTSKAEAEMCSVFDSLEFPANK